MAEPFVECQVDTCTHWLKNNRCGAKNIDILNQAPDNTEDYTKTRCKTFYQKRGLANMMGSLDNVNWWGAIGSVLGDQSLTPSVTCTVDDCQFWVQGNRCEATGITVNGKGAEKCGQTNCQTYRIR